MSTVRRTVTADKAGIIGELEERKAEMLARIASGVTPNGTGKTEARMILARYRGRADGLDDAIRLLRDWTGEPCDGTTGHHVYDQPDGARHLACDVCGWDMGREQDARANGYGTGNVRPHTRKAAD